MIAQDKLDKARKLLEKKLFFKKITRIEKYKNLNRAQYLQLLDKLAKFSALIIECFMAQVGER